MNQGAPFILQVLTECAQRILREEFSLVGAPLLLSPALIAQQQSGYVTVFIELESAQPLTFALSMERPLIERISHTYTRELGLAESELGGYLENSAADIANIIVGNATADLGITGRAVPISSPIVVTGATKISLPKKGVLLASSIETECGKLVIYCIGLHSCIETNCAGDITHEAS